MSALKELYHTSPTNYPTISSATADSTTAHPAILIASPASWIVCFTNRLGIQSFDVRGLGQLEGFGNGNHARSSCKSNMKSGLASREDNKTNDILDVKGRYVMMFPI